MRADLTKSWSGVYIEEEVVMVVGGGSSGTVMVVVVVGGWWRWTTYDGVARKPLSTLLR